ncbi:T9SS type A sorting domain-containing protein [Aequorivita sp. CIP111184]|uniref:T9SS type A sorting domain-containing protein n=1 Tax=Aequorivita sp. CIP111184 TaxID=2211356 RepID=UPI000DBC317F|nr:T9SS type A sorting domain-containing protein [Aequorivita sp. CIP111184]SRX55878.1 hypothetical protein AEQU1_02904 [Aequorivita sp. CIP111184]
MKHYIILLAAFTTLIMNAQDPQIEWQKTLGGNFSDMGRVAAPSPDGGSLIATSSLSNISGNRTVPLIGITDVWLIKLNAAGNVQWQKAIGGSGSETPSSLESTSDGGYILGVLSNSDSSGDKSENSIGGKDFWIVKLNEDGTIAWENTIGGSEDETAPKVAQTLDGGYLVGGSSFSNISGDKTENNVGDRDYWALKLDSNGIIVWQNTIGGVDLDQLNDILVLSNGNYILGGNSNSNASGDKSENSNGSDDYWIVNLNALGDIVWENTIGGNDGDYLKFLVQKDSETILVGGNSFSGISGDKSESSRGEQDLWILTLGLSGNILSQKTLGGDLNEFAANAVITDSNKYIVGSASSSSASGDKNEDSQGSTDYWILYLDENFNILDQNTIGGSNNDSMSTIIKDINDEIILVGSSMSDISGDKTENSLGGFDAWIIKLKNFALGIEEITYSEISVYPVPASDEVYFSIQNNVFEQIEIYDALGRLITSNYPKTNLYTLDILNFSSGIYFCEVVVSGKKTIKKFIKK